MKKHASGFQIGAYVAGGLVGLYLFGAVGVYTGTIEGHSEFHSKDPPDLLRYVVVFLYYPLFDFLSRQGWLP
jgi:hypothetical protein